MENIKIIQFGEGKFLRAFVDVVIQHANHNLAYKKYSVDLIQPLEFDQLMNSLDKKNYEYHVNEINPALDINQVVKIDCIHSGLDPYKDFEAFKALAIDPKAKYVFSNTTESGIVYVDETFQTESILASFPGKVLQLLKLRYEALGVSGKLIFVPCELIEENAKTLKSILLKKASKENLDQDFIDFIESCEFYDTLVDRIVVGYQENKFNDPNYILCEPFMKWVIDSKELDFAKDANLSGIIFDDVVIHRELKVKILNGLHTALTPFAILNKIDFVHHSFESQFMNDKIQKLLVEILATIQLENKEEYARTIIERFKNEKLNHKFTDIMLNSLDKYETRVYPSVLQNLEQGLLPIELLSSLAAIIIQYKCGYPTNDAGNVELWENLDLENPAKTLIDYKFKELKNYTEAIEFINKKVKELRGKYEKHN
ncbi:MAG: hypothetical protein ACK5LM_04190 [Lactovum sp.]